MISIIIPVFNAEKYLERCLDSIINQTYKDIEVIVVNDGSTDSSSIIAESYAGKYPNICVIHQKNEGPMSACREGIKRATGEFVGFVDSDDWVEPSMYENMINTAVTNNADIVQCGYYLHAESRITKFLNSNIEKTYNKKQIYNELVENLLSFPYNNRATINPSRGNKLFKSYHLQNNIKYYGKNIMLGEDMNLMYAILLDCNRIVCINECYYHYQRNNTSITQRYIENLPDSNKALFSNILKLTIEKRFKQECYVNFYINYMVIYSIHNLSKSQNSRKMIKQRIKEIRKSNPSSKFLMKYFKAVKTKQQKIVAMALHCKLDSLLVTYVLLIKMLRKINTQI